MEVGNHLMVIQGSIFHFRFSDYFRECMPLRPFMPLKLFSPQHTLPRCNRCCQLARAPAIKPVGVQLAPTDRVTRACLFTFCHPSDFKRSHVLSVVDLRMSGCIRYRRTVAGSTASCLQEPFASSLRPIRPIPGRPRKEPPMFHTPRATPRCSASDAADDGRPAVWLGGFDPKGFCPRPFAGCRQLSA